MLTKKLFLALTAGVIFYLLILRDVPLQAYPLIIDYKRVTPVSPLYYVKTIREFMQAKFTFGEEEQSYRYLILANKRITEAEYLQSRGVVVLAKRQIDLARDYQKKGSKYLENLKDKVDINYLLQIEKDNENRLKFF